MDQERTMMTGGSERTAGQGVGRGSDADAFNTWLRRGLAAQYGEPQEDVPEALMALLCPSH